jgi:hypothetical protein
LVDFQGHFGGFGNNSDKGNLLPEMDTACDVFINIVCHWAPNQEQTSFHHSSKILAKASRINEPNAQL